MGKKRIEGFIPKAIEAVKDCKIANEKNEVPKQFNGYISSFGASIRAAGVVPTVLFFKNADNAEEDRSKVVTAVETILGEKLVQNGRRNTRITRDAIEDAATALKLAVRTFKLIDKE